MIDERIVSMKFNNSGFLNGIKSTLDGLGMLKKATQLDGATKGIDELSRATGRFSMANMGTQVQGVNAKFLALATVAVTALSRITSAAMATGSQLIKSLTVDPIKAGLQEYETNLNAIQTILANTQSKGTTLDDVNGSLAELNTYADKTIYNFSEMARNIGTFTAAGVALDPATDAIKGIANLAAVSGSSSQQASTAMYQLSQALSTGSVKLMDWNSVVNAGMGGELFQENLKESARNHGVAVDEIIEKNGSFRDSLQEGWISDEILLESLQKMTGDLSDEQLRQMGYTEEQIPKIQEMAKTAQDAATKVKTVSQLIGTLQEAAGSGWAKTWQLIFGDFEEAKELFTGVNNVLGGMIGASADARNEMLQGWKDLGGRDSAIAAVSNAFKAVMAVVGTLKDTFREFFPSLKSEQLFNITKAIENFTAAMIPSQETLDRIGRIAAGVFAVLSIGVEVIKAIAGVIGRVVGALLEGSGGVADFAGSIADWLVLLNRAVIDGEGFTGFFEKVGDVLVNAIKYVKDFAGNVADAFGNLDFGGAEEALDSVRSRLEPLGIIGDTIAFIWRNLGGAFSKAYEIFKPMATAMADFFGQVGSLISDALANVDYSKALDTINTGLFAVLTVMISKFLKGDFKGEAEGGGLVDKIKETFGAVTDTFGAMQASLKAGTLQKIAIAIALITASVVALSFIDSAKLTKALVGISIMIAQLAGAMVLLDVATKGGGFLKLPFISAALVGLGAALLVLSASVMLMSTMSWDELARGLGGLAGMLLILAGALKLMSGSTKGLTTAAAGLIALSIGVRILASAVTELSGLSWGDLAKGLVGVGTLLGALALFTKFASVGKSGMANAGGLILMAVAIKVLASAVGDFGAMSVEEIAKGLLTMGASLIIIGGAFLLIDKVKGSMISGAAALVIVSAALILMGQALQTFGGMSWDEIGKSMVVLAGSLLILAGALYLMTAALPGAAALIVAAGALMILAPALVLLGTMSWDEIGRGLTLLASAIGILAVGGLLLLVAIPGLLALGAAAALIGAGALMAGTGVLALAAGIAALSLAAGAGAIAIVAVGSAVISLIPALGRALAQAVMEFVRVLTTSQPQILRAAVAMIRTILQAINQTAPMIISTFTKLMMMLLMAAERLIPQMIQTATKIIMALLDAISKIGPRIISTLMTLLTALVNAVARKIPEFANKGLQMITQLLNVIANNMGRIVTAGTNIVLRFIQGISQNIPRLVQAGINLVIQFINSLANGLRNNQSRMDAAGRNLASAIVSGMASGIRGGLSVVTGAAASLARSALSAAKNVLGIASPSKEFEKIGKFVNEGFAKGMMGNRGEVDKAFNQLRADVLAAQKNAATQVAKLTDQLKKQNQARVKNRKLIAATTAALNKARLEEQRASNVYHSAHGAGTLHRHQVALGRLADQHEVNAEKIKEATKALEDARKVRDDFNQSTTDKFSDLAGISETTRVSSYFADMTRRVEKTQQLTAKLQELKKLGLNESAYRELLEGGTNSLPFIDQLLNGGYGGVEKFNALTSQLTKASTDLAKETTARLYDAGVKSAEGIVKGLESEESRITAAMQKIADTMVRTVKSALGIRSPSREFEAVGRYSTEGMANGLSAGVKGVQVVADRLGKDTLYSLKKSMQGMGDMALTDIDIQPTIRPVLDLTDVKKEAGKMNGMLGSPRISADLTYKRAQSVAQRRDRYEDIRSEVEARSEKLEATRERVQYVQNNYSPKALSRAQIYRQTKNQLSRVKGRKTP